MMFRFDRDLVIRFIIGFSLTLGAWIFFAQPRAAELSRLEKTVSEFHKQTSSLGIAASEQIARDVQAMLWQLDQISARNSVSRDSARLYGHIKELANRHDVHVQKLQPTPEPPNRRNDMFTNSKVHMTIQGEYAAIAAFIDSLQEFGGHVRPNSLYLGTLPSQSQEIVNVRLACDVISFELPETLVQMQEETHGDS
ncbi:MAG: hypothetical protein IH984_10800 [Planctomycetes bacterium]|nr:hypothetical protein [Planctomycetota bacterium]